MRATRGAAAAAAILLSALGGEASDAAPAFTTRYVYYDVTGDTATGVYISMLKRGPQVNGAAAYAATSALPSQHGKLELTGSCRFIDYQYRTDFTIHLPKLTDENVLPATTLDRWRGFSRLLVRHEETHRAIWMGCANEIETRIRALRGQTCRELDEKAQEIRDQVQTACQGRHAAFDAAEQKKLARHPFVKMVLAPVGKPKRSVTFAAGQKRKKAAAHVN